MPEYRRILAVVDFTRGGLAVARRALGLARLGRCELVLLHLIEPDAALDGGYFSPSRAATRQSYETEALRRLDFLAATLGADEAKLLARHGQPRRAFAECIATWQPDLVVAGDDPGYLGGRHDLLILGRNTASKGRLSRWLNPLAQLAGFSGA